MTSSAVLVFQDDRRKKNKIRIFEFLRMAIDILKVQMRVLHRILTLPSSLARMQK